MTPKNLEIIIPVLPAEDKLFGLLNQIYSWPVRISIVIGRPGLHHFPKILCYDEAKEILKNTFFDPLWDPNRFQWLSESEGRAGQLNAAANLSKAHFFWFLHGDSILEEKALDKVLAFVNQTHNSLGYGRLSFDRDGPFLCHLNGFGANFRSSVFKMPFEDQGLVVSKENFDHLGGFSTNVPYGEGHDFVWRAKLDGISLQPLGYKITTSSRRYKNQGWLATTARFFYLTWRQALPYIFRRLLSSRKKQTALAVFVKTSGLSHMKTRLSRTIGVKGAETFQQLALSEISNTLQDLRNVTVYWAISEADAMYFEQWQGFSKIIQADGDLGDKIDHVYSQLIAKFHRVIVIGSDAPQMTKSHLDQACLSLDSHEYVLGPAKDGGFWLFGGRFPIPRSIWKSTPWSAPDTLKRLYELLDELLGQKPALLQALTDVDTVEDLSEMLQEGQDLSPAFRQSCQSLLTP